MVSSSCRGAAGEKGRFSRKEGEPSGSRRLELLVLKEKHSR